MREAATFRTRETGLQLTSAYQIQQRERCCLRERRRLSERSYLGPIKRSQGSKRACNTEDTNQPPDLPLESVSCGKELQEQTS